MSHIQSTINTSASKYAADLQSGPPACGPPRRFTREIDMTVHTNTDIRDMRAFHIHDFVYIYLHVYFARADGHV